MGWHLCLSLQVASLYGWHWGEKLANSDLQSATKVSTSTGKWFAGWFGAFGILYMMAEIDSMADLAATFAIGILIGTAVLGE